MYSSRGKSRSRRQPSCGVWYPRESPERLHTDAVLDGHRYIKWMQEYGVGGGKADLLKVLEACTKELQKHSRYNNDVRCLRVWIQYVSAATAPQHSNACVRGAALLCPVPRTWHLAPDVQPPSFSCTGGLPS